MDEQLQTANLKLHFTVTHESNADGCQKLRFVHAFVNEGAVWSCGLRHTSKQVWRGVWCKKQNYK